MLISRYSAPDFNPYGDESPDDPDVLWAAPVATAGVRSVVALPGSKSLTNRELVLSALADAPSRLRAPLHSRDTALMIDALRSLGVSIEETMGGGDFGPDLTTTPAEEPTGPPTTACGLAGTAMRSLPPVAGPAPAPTPFEGDGGARR